ncbi:hypothetical protein Tco_0271345 [Tanacetum coccineum]
MSSRTLPAIRLSPSLLKFLKSLCSSSGTPLRRSQAQTPMSFFLLKRSAWSMLKCSKRFLTSVQEFNEYMYVDHMHQPWRTLAAIINKCLYGKAASNDRLRKSRIDILWGMFYRENVDYPELI